MQIYNLDFTEQQIREAVAADRLLSMEIEFSRVCNFRCSYCYVDEKVDTSNELSRAEIKDVILQAKELGARKIIILGGEPSIYPHLVEMLAFLAENCLDVEMFTNGSGIDKALAAVLAEHKVRIALKMNSRNEQVQDKLAGKKGAFHIINKALSALQEAGYPSQELFLAVSTVICRQNIKELPAMWQWLREENIEPYFEIITPQANALENSWLGVGPQELKELFSQLSAIDQKKFHRNWDPQPPLVGNKCMRHQVSCVVTAVGDVMPCVGVTIALDNIRLNKLGHILKNSEVVNNLKNYREMIKGECKSCEKAAECYGCRGAAYQLTGDYLAADPTCWRNAAGK
ncbi:radical SAM protein [Desulfopila sp. IMCC35006]|uniref:radical SAM/SPASM domain-containing protein n=1 Tax=Desulfopila sp. IMCC35006 TaxID=2569542 RepID=UPI0010AD7EE3|nr:radical SAM protein [Desulfopila sp. IMCC35006]TKB28237.1 radical SAM protein [Desulfopila sp. IMCC35006]